jgi:hypothetical protein
MALKRKKHSRPSVQPKQASPGTVPRWLTGEQIRKQQRMRRERVIAAMLSGELPYEQRGRIRYARACDVEAWELSRLKGPVVYSTREIYPYLADLA